MKILVSKLFRVREVPVFLGLIIVVLITGTANPAFFTLSGFQDVTLGVAVIAVLAIAQTLVIVMKHIDLSVGSTIGFSAFLIGDASSKGHGFWYCMGLALALGLAVGAANGFMVGYLKLPSLVVTLGTLYIVKGIFNEVAGGTTITADMVPGPISFLGLNTFLGFHIYS